MRTQIQRRQSVPAHAPALVSLAESLSPGMAQVLEKLVAGYLCGVRPQFDLSEAMLLQCAAAALSVVNRTPGSAEAIGRQAAVSVCRNPQSVKLLGVAPPGRLA